MDKTLDNVSKDEIINQLAMDSIFWQKRYNELSSMSNNPILPILSIEETIDDAKINILGRKVIFD